MHRLITLLALGIFGFMIWAIYIANTGGRSIFFDYSQSIPNGDKIGHLVLFGSLSLFANFAFKLKTIKLGFIPVYLGSLLVFLFALFEEVSQDFIPSRTMDIRDFYADCIGIGISIVLTLCISKISEYTQTRLNSKLRNR